MSASLQPEVGEVETTIHDEDLAQSTSLPAENPTPIPVQTQQIPTTQADNQQSESHTSPRTTSKPPVAAPASAPTTTEVRRSTSTTTTTAVPVPTLPRGTFLTSSGGKQFICQQRSVSFDDFDCIDFYGQMAVSFFNPTLFCSGSQSRLTCSELWYPNDLSRYEIWTINSGTHICRTAILNGSSFGDYDCARYRGGDPLRVSFVSALKCSQGTFGTDCRSDYYPSEVEGLEIRSIEGVKVVCKRSFSGYDCYRWSGYGSPKSAIGYSPDYECDGFWNCRKRSSW